MAKQKKYQRLNDIFAELGMPTIEAQYSLDDARMIAEDEGVVELPGNQRILESCEGKLCYPSRAQAEKVKKRRLRKGGLTHLCSYHCPKCKQWHLTSTKR